MGIADIQRALIARGYDLGPTGADDVAGRATRAAVAAFQRANGLKPDGIVGALTLSKLVPEIITPPPGLLSPAIFRMVAPGARADIVAAMITRPDKFAAAQIVTRRRMAHFLSQTATETGGFKALSESLNYSAAGLVKTFKKYFPTLASTAGFVGDPRAIANKVYGGRLGNTQPNDGWDYRGGGIMQNTGRANYRAAGFENDPEALRRPDSALDAALAFWVMNGLNAIADSGTVAQVRKRVNGGSNGLDEAEAYFGKACRALGV